MQIRDAAGVVSCFVGLQEALGYPDSNQERQDQNLQCYHYTIAQCFRFAGAKVGTFVETGKLFPKKM